MIIMNSSVKKSLKCLKMSYFIFRLIGQKEKINAILIIHLGKTNILTCQLIISY